MICKVKKTIEGHKLLTDVKTVAVGVSGGADSMCLLHILSSLKDEYGIILKVVHLNHNLRGEEALRDENFVREYCKKNDISLSVFSVDIKALSLQKGLSEEECGRIERYKCFESLGCDAVATAHTLSDSIETMLFNLARGTALKGLCGIPVKREPDIIRPLINCTRQEIEEYCEINGVPYITDSTNLTDDYTRNHIRHNLIPDLERINTGYEKNISRCFSSLSDDEDFLSGETLRVLKECETENGYRITALQKSHKAIRKRALALILKNKMRKSTENKHVELLDDILMKSEGKIEIASDVFVNVKNNLLFFTSGDLSAGEWKSEFFDNKAETPTDIFKIIKCDNNDPDAIDSDKIKSDLFLSSRQEGDRFTFKKRGISKSLKKLYNEMKIPASKRNEVAVLHDGENVVWIDEIGVSAQYCVDENTKSSIKIVKEGRKRD